MTIANKFGIDLLKFAKYSAGFPEASLAFVIATAESARSAVNFSHNGLAGVRKLWIFPKRFWCDQRPVRIAIGAVNGMPDFLTGALNRTCRSGKVKPTSCLPFSSSMQFLLSILSGANKSFLSGTSSHGAFRLGKPPWSVGNNVAFRTILNIGLPYFGVQKTWSAFQHTVAGRQIKSSWQPSVAYRSDRLSKIRWLQTMISACQLKWAFCQTRRFKNRCFGIFWRLPKNGFGGFQTKLFLRLPKKKDFGVCQKPFWRLPNKNMLWNVCHVSGYYIYIVYSGDWPHLDLPNIGRHFPAIVVFAACSLNFSIIGFHSPLLWRWHPTNSAWKRSVALARFCCIGIVAHATGCGTHTISLTIVSTAGWLPKQL